MTHITERRTVSDSCLKLFKGIISYIVVDWAHEVKQQSDDSDVSVLHGDVQCTATSLCSQSVSECATTTANYSPLVSVYLQFSPPVYFTPTMKGFPLEFGIGTGVRRN